MTTVPSSGWWCDTCRQSVVPSASGMCLFCDKKARKIVATPEDRGVVEWSDPPASAGPGRKGSRWDATLDALAGRPGQWAVVEVVEQSERKAMHSRRTAIASRGKKRGMKVEMRVGDHRMGVGLWARVVLAEVRDEAA